MHLQNHLRDDEDRKHAIKNNQVKIREDVGLPVGATLITGGTCAAMRAIGMLHTMGFRNCTYLVLNVH